jgi:hypothetical protein
MHRLRRLSRGGQLLLALAVGGVVFGITTAVQADIPDGGVIHGCYGKPGTTYKGQLREPARLEPDRPHGADRPHRADRTTRTRWGVLRGRRIDWNGDRLLARRHGVPHRRREVCGDLPDCRGELWSHRDHRVQQKRRRPSSGRRRNSGGPEHRGTEHRPHSDLLRGRDGRRLGFPPDCHLLTWATCGRFGNEPPAHCPRVTCRRFTSACSNSRDCSA